MCVAELWTARGVGVCGGVYYINLLRQRIDDEVTLLTPDGGKMSTHK